MCEVINETFPKARKEYKCQLCGCNINKGTIHYCQVAKAEGKICAFRMHKECTDLLSKLDPIDFDDFEGLLDDTVSSNYPSKTYENEIDDDVQELSTFEQVKMVLSDINNGVLIKSHEGYYKRK